MKALGKAILDASAMTAAIICGVSAIVAAFVRHGELGLSGWIGFAIIMIGLSWATIRAAKGLLEWSRS